MEDAVTLSCSDGIAVIALNRPDNRNSMTPELLESFSKVTQTVRANRDVRAVVITGRGRCFSAGADFKSNLQTGGEHLLDHERSFQMYEPFLGVLDIEVPVIGALCGHAVGGGFGLALVCDIRIAHHGSKYGANFTKLGLSPGMSISYLLPRLVGVSRANELLFSGRLVLGDEAERIGLVSSAHETPEQVLDEAMRMASAIAENAAHRESFAQAATLKTQDASEGMAALLEKRKPEFHGK